MSGGEDGAANKISGDHQNEDDENVRVMVRCRPPARRELKELGCVEAREEDGAIIVTSEAGDPLSSSTAAAAATGRREFYFDSVFGPQSDNDRVYMRSCRRLVESAFEGYNCTVFLYGQTGTGKTYTHSSIALNSFAHLFTLIKTSNAKAQFLIRASYYELYNEDIRDLLAPAVSVVLRLYLNGTPLLCKH